MFTVSYRKPVFSFLLKAHLRRKVLVMLPSQRVETSPGWKMDCVPCGITDLQDADFVEKKTTTVEWRSKRMKRSAFLPTREYTSKPDTY